MCLGAGETLHGEGILAIITKALLQSGVAYVGGYQAAPVSHLLDVQAKFLNSAAFGEDIEIETTVEQWNNKTFVMLHVAPRGETILAEVREVRIFAIHDPEDKRRIKSILVPEDIKAACVMCRQGACGICRTEGAVTELPVA